MEHIYAITYNENFDEILKIRQSDMNDKISPTDV